MSTKAVCGSKHLLNSIFLSLWLLGSDIWAFRNSFFKDLVFLRGNFCRVTSPKRKIYIKCYLENFKFSAKKIPVIRWDCDRNSLKLKKSKKTREIRKLYWSFSKFRASKGVAHVSCWKALCLLRKTIQLLQDPANQHCWKPLKCSVWKRPQISSFSPLKRFLSPLSKYL